MSAARRSPLVVPHATRGYTLIEILAAFFILTIILTMVTGIFVENGRQRAAALGLMGESLSSTAALDQIAEDLEGALFLSGPRGQRPDENPWRFVGEAPSELGAGALRFVTQNAPASNPALHASGWVEVAYFLEEDREGQVVLWRWLSARPPSDLSSRFPDSESDGAMRLAVDVQDFGVRFLAGEGEWLEEWDSAYQPPEYPIPQGAEISLALMRPARRGEAEDGAEKLPGPLHVRRVALPMPPLDVQSLLALGADGEEEGPDCFTVSACLAEGESAWYEALLDSDCDGDDDLCDLLVSAEDTCWEEIERVYPAVASRAPDGCAS